MKEISFRSQIPKLIEPQLGNSHIHMAELGVAKGWFSKSVLEDNPNLHLMMIDRWAGDRGHDVREMQTAESVTRFADDRRILVQTTFEKAAYKTPDGAFDIVYIDGYAHTGQDGGRTLEMWWPKVRKGGIFAGHDYHPKWQPTIDAVNKFILDLLDTEGRAPSLQFTKGDEYPSWYIFKS